VRASALGKKVVKNKEKLAMFQDFWVLTFEITLKK